MQQSQGANATSNGPRLSTGSHSSVSGATNALLNGLLPPHRPSQTLINVPVSLSASQFRPLRKGSEQLNRMEKVQQATIVFSLTVVLAVLLIITVQLSTTLVRDPFVSNSSARSSLNRSELIDGKQRPMGAFFAAVWLFNVLLFLHCLFIHLLCLRRRSRRTRTVSTFLRDLVRIFVDGHSSSSNTFVDCLIKTSVLCFLWYLSCYLLIRSMSILISTDVVILFSITVTLRQLLGWIFLHEQFIGNKIIAHILALSALLFLAHNDGFRFNRFLFGLTIVSCAVGSKTIFDILVNAFVKDLTSSKLTIVMIDISLFGTFLLWPIVLLAHFTRLESFDYQHIRWLLTSIALTSALIFNLLTIVIPFRYMSLASVASLLLVIPLTSVIDHYLWHVTYSPLVISAILCSFAGVLLSLIPKQWFQAGETGKMKQALGLLNKDAASNANATTGNATNTSTGTSSAFEEIRAQRRIRNALLYNDVKP